jgi:hypothetical protein
MHACDARSWSGEVLGERDRVATSLAAVYADEDTVEHGVSLKGSVWTCERD